MTALDHPLVSNGAIPALYPCLGICLHLESFTPDDVPRLEEVNGLVLDWLGERMRWTLNSAVTRFEPFRPEDLDYVTLYPEHLEVPKSYPVGTQEHVNEQLVERLKHTDFGMFCHGGQSKSHASPFAYRFYSEICWLADSDVFPTCPVLRLSVPMDWPLDDFYARATTIAGKLRLRWGNAGLSYSGNAIDFWNDVHEGIYQHARRYPGYDPAFYVGFMEEWFRELRTVSWLTWLGPEFRAMVGPLESDSQVRVQDLGDSLLLQAGSAPLAGDANRRDIPKAYARADQMVRAVRAKQDKNFLHPWSERLTERWLRRFELRWN